MPIRGLQITIGVHYVLYNHCRERGWNLPIKAVALSQNMVSFDNRSGVGINDSVSDMFTGLHFGPDVYRMIGHLTEVIKWK